MRARLVAEDGLFVAEVLAPDGTAWIRFGERFFGWSAELSGVTVFEAVEVYAAKAEGALVVEP